MSRSHIAIVMFCAALGGGRPLFAQCDLQWLFGPGQGLPGVGTVRASIAWDPDGAGPQPSLFIVGGSFHAAGDIGVQNIAAWNGDHWMPLGSGVNNTVFALAVYDGDLIAAGDFTTAGGASASHIARWNGAEWTALGSGINGSVYALTVYGNNLIAGGYFPDAGGSTVNYLARWDGTSWVPMSDGMNGISYVYALAVYYGDLYAAGRFLGPNGVPVYHMARWNGTSWDFLASDILHANVHALVTYGHELIVGGDFILNLGQDGPISAYWARWGCQPCPDDWDCDTIPDTSDNCPQYANVGQEDDDNDMVGNACDLCPGTIPAAPTDDQGCPPFHPADFDRDGDVDSDDFFLFRGCTSGAMIPHEDDMICLLADFDGDNDVDAKDFGMFQLCLSGTDILADEGCIASEP